MGWKGYARSGHGLTLIRRTKKKTPPQQAAGVLTAQLQRVSYILLQVKYEGFILCTNSISLSYSGLLCHDHEITLHSGMWVPKCCSNVPPSFEADICQAGEVTD